MAKKITVRKPGFTFPHGIEKYWVDGNAFKSCFGNAFTLLFPAAEKYFVRTSKKFLPGQEKPELRKAALAFIGQETQHANQHQKYWENMQEQGYSIEPITNLLDNVLGLAETYLSDEEQLALVAGLEHYTALMAEILLKNDALATAEPKVRDLFEWHCVEELEHKAVAYDLLQNTNHNYFLRTYIMIYATILFVFLSTSAILILAAQDNLLFKFSFWKEAVNVLFLKEKLFPQSLEIFLEYFDPTFHPNNRNHDHLLDKFKFLRRGIA
ncbi:MAG: metal-dependent hydrolase [Spirochaetota bacterium]